MKRLIILLSTVLLTGCYDNFVERKFPEIVEDLKSSCPSLQQIDPATNKLSTVVDSVVVNYSTYYECKVKVDAWIEWYRAQKEIFESIK